LGCSKEGEGGPGRGQSNEKESPLIDVAMDREKKETWYWKSFQELRDRVGGGAGVVHVGLSNRRRGKRKPSRVIGGLRDRVTGGVTITECA